MRKKLRIVISALTVTCSATAFSSGNDKSHAVAGSLFPAISTQVINCYSTVLENKENDFRWENAEDQALFVDTYLHDTLEVLSGDQAPGLASKFGTFSKMKGISSRQLITMIGCARYITGKNYGGKTNSFTGALKIYSSFRPETKAMLFENFDATYDSFTGTATKKPEKLEELSRREAEFMVQESSDPGLMDKLSRMDASEGSHGTSWEFAREIARSSYGVCQEFEAPGLFSGIRDAISFGWRSLWGY